MNKSTMEAYAEVDKVLSLMDYKYIAEIPEELRKMFKEKKDSSYNKEITADKPLKEQNLSKETLSILAVLNYNYWCKDENRKNELIELYSENEKKYQEELREKYNPDNIFKEKLSRNFSEEKVEEKLSLIGTNSNESVFTRIKNWIINLLKRR